MDPEDDLYNHSGDEHRPDEVPNDPFEDQRSEHEQQLEGKQGTEILKVRRNPKKTPARKPNLTFEDDDPVSSPALSKDPGVGRDDRWLQDIIDGAPAPVAPLTARGKDSGNSWSPLYDSEVWNAEYDSRKSNEPPATDALMEDITRSMDQTIDETNGTPAPAPDQEKPTGGDGKNRGQKKGKKGGARKASNGDLKAKKAPDTSAEEEPDTTTENKPAEEHAPRLPSPSAPRSSVAAMAAKMNKDAAGVSPLRPSSNGLSAPLARSSTVGHPSGLQRSLAVGEASSRRSSLAPSVNEKVPEATKLDTLSPSSLLPAGKPNNLPKCGEQDPVEPPMSPKTPLQNATKQPTVSKHSTQRDDISTKVGKDDGETPTAVAAACVAKVSAPDPVKTPEGKPRKTTGLPKKDEEIESSSTPTAGALTSPVPAPTEVKKTDPTRLQVKLQDSTLSPTAPGPSSNTPPKSSPQEEAPKDIKPTPPGPLKVALRRKSIPSSNHRASKDVVTAPAALPDGRESTEEPSSPGPPPASPSVASQPPASQEPPVPDFERETIQDQERPQGLQRKKSVRFEEQEIDEQRKPSERPLRRSSHVRIQNRSSSPKYKRKVIDKAYRQRERRANSTQADDEPEGEDVVCTSSEDWCGECQQKSTKVTSAVPQRYLDCDPEYYPVTLSCVLHGKTNDAGDIAAAVSKRLNQFTSTDVPVHAVVRRAAAGTHRAGKWYDVTTKEGCSTASGKLVKCHQKTKPLEVFFWRWTMNRDERKRKMSHEKRKLRDFRLLIDICIPIEEDGPIELEMIKALPSNVTVQKATLIRDHPCGERLSWWAKTHPYVYDRVSSRHEESESRGFEHSSRRRSSDSHRSSSSHRSSTSHRGSKESKSRPKSEGASFLKSLFSGSSSMRNEITGAPSKSRYNHSDSRHRRRESRRKRRESDIESFLAPPSSKDGGESSRQRRRHSVYRGSEAGSFLQSPTIREV
ncbi:uncharacterized protein BDV14DRAFT_195407 [Aspergillus stella-maris]|uniref:uncharacterized protein n=1 Tax=Aspergillus stella-maris TaxID=1810926 RepID=UPI003CCD4CD8